MKGTLIFTLALLLGFACFLTTGFAQTYDHHDTLNEGTGLARALAFSPDGTLLASGGGSNVYLHAPGTGMLERILRGHTATVTVVAFSPDGRMLASASGDRTIKLWNPQTGQLIRTLRGHTNQIYAIAFSRTGQLASGGRDNTVRLWNTQNGANRIIGGHGGWVLSVAFSSTGLLASSSRDNTIRIWNATTGAQLRPLIGHTNFVTSVAFTATDDTLVSGSRDNTIRIWNAATGGAALQTLRGHTDAINSVAVSASGTIASASADETARLWNLSTGTRIATFDEHTDLVRVVAFSRDGRWLASGSVDGAVQVWQRSGAGVTPVVQTPQTGGGGGTVQPTNGWLATVVPSIDGNALDTGSSPVAVDTGETIDIIVSVTRNGRRVRKKAVLLSVEGGGPTLSKSEGISDDNGQVPVTLKLGANEGTFKFIVKAEGEFVDEDAFTIGELSFTATEGPGAGAGSIEVSSPTIVEPRGGNYDGRIRLDFTVKTPAGNPVVGAAIDVDKTSGPDIMDIPNRPKTDSNGKATLTVRLKNTNQKGTLTLRASVVSSNPLVEKTRSITVRQTAHRLSVSGVPRSITSGETRTITATVTSKNGTGMPGVTVKFTDSPNDSEIAFSSTSRTTSSSGKASTTLRTGSKGSANFRVEASGLSSQSFNLTVEPDTASQEKYKYADGRRIGFWDDNYWYQDLYRFTFPGKVVSYSWRSRTSNANVDKNDVRKSGNTVYVPVNILAKTFPTATIRLWVTATYEVTASSPGAPSLHSQFGPETQQLSTFWQDLYQVPEKTALLPNYPNPFNPETWIPYRLAEAAEVTLSIYSLNGNRVRTLALGHRPAGFYESRSRAAYWDGRNAIGERVASGVYFYTLTAGDFAATGKMLILK